MPLVNPNGPGWSRPVVLTSARRLEGFNPVWRFISRMLGRVEKPRHVPVFLKGAEPGDGSAGSGVTAGLVPPGPTLPGTAAKPFPPE